MKCKARVQQGTYTYAARNAERPCGNAARENGFCHAHQPPEPLSDNQRAAMESIRASLQQEAHA